MREFLKEHIAPEMIEVMEEYPEIFLEASTYIKSHTAGYDSNAEICNLRYGFEHGIGWKEIVRGFCADIREFCTRTGASYKACIMKEKFGMFTPQGDWSNLKDEDWKGAHEIESKWGKMSLTVCELTGKPGKLRTSKGWWRTLSDEKAKELGYL